LEQYQRDFIKLAIDVGALRFGEFKLKSGRLSPYFFNAGSFSNGVALAALGRCYAATIEGAGIEYEVLLGPAYKGIPLVSATSIALADQFQRSAPYCFNRKEAKEHGEGGCLVGAPLVGRALVIDDVITAGTAIREVMAMISAAGASCAGVVVGVNRQERGTGELSAIQEVEREYGISVYSIVCLDDIVDYIAEDGGMFAQFVQQMEVYRNNYGVS
jgi:orotate phosphoribosyltransferase